jgi:hypothetical protein
MITRTRPAPTLLVLAIGCLLSAIASAGSFVYEGRLQESGSLANGRYDFEILAHADATLGGPIAPAIRFDDVEVVDGRFRLDFELPAAGADQVWLGLAVRSHGSSSDYAAFPARSKAVEAGPIGLCWSSSGDSNTDPAVNFLGTTDAQPLVLRTANARSLRIEPSSMTFGTPALPITTNTIGGSHANTVTAGVRGATIAGGGVPSGDSDPDLLDEAPNRITDHYGAVGGGYANTAGDNAGTQGDRPYDTVGGGRLNTARGGYSFVGGGEGNTAAGPWSAVGAGYYNSASQSTDTVGGGSSNAASGSASTVAGGSSNRASGQFSTIGGGRLNTASGVKSTVSGGEDNDASGIYSTVGGGYLNCAGAQHSWAGGRGAKVRPATNPGGANACSGLTYPGGSGDGGTFVWADSQIANFISTGPNQFLARADGGFGFNTNAIPAGIEAVLQGRTGANGNVDLYLKPAAHGRGINLAMLPGAGAAAFYISQYDGSSFVDRILLAANGDFSVTQQAFKPGGGSWAALSDERLKTGLVPLVGTLDRLLALRGVEYQYRPELTPKAMYLPGRQVGFIAQEVEQVFPDWVSQSDDGYKTVGPRGFEALTVEALRELRTESATIDSIQSERIAALESQLAEQTRQAERERAKLRSELAELRAALAALAGDDARHDPDR